MELGDWLLGHWDDAEDSVASVVFKTFNELTEPALAYKDLLQVDLRLKYWFIKGCAWPLLQSASFFA